MTVSRDVGSAAAEVCRFLTSISLYFQYQLRVESCILIRETDVRVSSAHKTLSKVPYLTVGISSYFDMLAANAFIGGRSRRDESTDTASPCAESGIM